jgi:hypothetical protein
MANIEILREPGRMIVRSAHGYVSVEFPASDIALITYEGVALEAFVEPVVTEIQSQARFPVALAVDAAALSSYETGFRKRWTAWMDARKPRAVYILSNSRLVVMGIALANAVLGGTIRGFATRPEFEHAVAELGRPASSSVHL